MSSFAFYNTFYVSFKNEKPTNEPWLGDEENYSLNKGQVKNCLNACPDLGSPISALRLAAYIFDLTQVSFLVNSIVTSLNNECQFLTGAMDSSSDRDYHLNVILNLWRSKLRSSGDLFNSTRILLFKSLYQRFVQDSPAAISQKDLDNKAKALSLLLNNRELAFSLFPSIELHLRNWLSSKEPSSFSLSFNSLDKIIDPIVKNVKEYVNEYPTQTQNILQGKELIELIELIGMWFKPWTLMPNLADKVAKPTSNRQVKKKLRYFDFFKNQNFSS